MVRHTHVTTLLHQHFQVLRMFGRAWLASTVQHCAPRIAWVLSGLLGVCRPSVRLSVRPSVRDCCVAERACPRGQSTGLLRFRRLLCVCQRFYFSALGPRSKHAVSAPHWSAVP